MAYSGEINIKNPPLLAFIYLLCIAQDTSDDVIARSPAFRKVTRQSYIT